MNNIIHSNFNKNKLCFYKSKNLKLNEKYNKQQVLYGLTYVY